MLSQNAIEYTLQQILTTALPTKHPSTFQFQLYDNRLLVEFTGKTKLNIILLSETEFQIFLAGKSIPTMLASADGKTVVPFFQSSTCDCEIPIVDPETQTLTIPYDIISPSFALLSRLEEYGNTPHDAHNRFPYAFSLACKYHCANIPLVDEYAMLLRMWVCTLLKSDLDLKPRRFRIVPTHDIDHLYRFSNPTQAMRSIFGRDLLLYHDLQIVKASVHAYKKWRKDHKQDPYIAAIIELIQQSKRYETESHFFFKALTPDEPDYTYNIFDPRVAHCVEHILENGMHVGLHGSYHSYQSPEKLCQEKERLENVVGRSILEGRQHYLRYHNHNTLHVWQTAKLQHDYTLGYAEMPGFRCGTCHPYPLYDLDNDQSTNIIEHPLIVMDGSLLDYLKLNIEEGYRVVSLLQQRCKAVEGDFVILWHNHLLSRNYRKAYENIYEKMYLCCDV